MILYNQSKFKLQIFYMPESSGSPENPGALKDKLQEFAISGNTPEIIGLLPVYLKMLKRANEYNDALSAISLREALTNAIIKISSTSMKDAEAIERALQNLKSKKAKEDATKGPSDLFDFFSGGPSDALAGSVFSLPANLLANTPYLGDFLRKLGYPFGAMFEKEEYSKASTKMFNGFMKGLEGVLDVTEPGNGFFIT